MLWRPDIEATGTFVCVWHFKTKSWLKSLPCPVLGRKTVVCWYLCVWWMESCFVSVLIFFVFYLVCSLMWMMFFLLLGKILAGWFVQFCSLSRKRHKRFHFHLSRSVRGAIVEFWSLFHCNTISCLCRSFVFVCIASIRALQSVKHTIFSAELFENNTLITAICCRSSRKEASHVEKVYKCFDLIFWRSILTQCTSSLALTRNLTHRKQWAEFESNPASEADRENVSLLIRPVLPQTSHKWWTHAKNVETVEFLRWILILEFID